ncbi:MAG: MFS transporter, partial [Aestuariivirgaceae bacterium]
TQSFLIWPVAFLMGVAAYAIYTAALAILGDEFKGADLISGAAAFAATWGIGGLIGPPIAGAALDSFGINTLPAFFILLYASLVVLMFACGGRLVRAPT